MSADLMILGIGTSLLALLGFPFMFMRSQSAMIGGALLTVPFIAFMSALTFWVR